MITDTDYPEWCGKYIDIRFKAGGRGRHGCDCWGLFRMVYRDEFGIFLKRYSGLYQSMTDTTGLLALFMLENSAWEKVESPRVGDGILLRVMGHPIHVGIVVSPNRMLHIERKLWSVIEPFDSIRWSKRVLGFYRNVQLRKRADAERDAKLESERTRRLSVEHLQAGPF
jgi:cell wall-associated NlpC family hydrolase